MSVIGTNISLTLRNVKGSELTYTELDNNQNNLKTAINNHSHDEFAAALGTDDNYVTDAEKVKLSNLSGTNTGDQDLSGYSLTTHNHTGVYQPAGTYSTDIHSNITALNSVSGVNTGDQDLSGYSLATHNHTGTYEPANSNIQSHISSTSNPHNVTAAQTGADPVGTAAGLVSTHASSNDHDGRYYTETETNSLLSNKQNTSEKGQALGYCPLDGSAKVAESYLPDSVLGQVEYQGVWNATTNTPTIPAASTSNKGWYYIVSVSGTTAVDGVAEWTIGDWIISNGTTWNKVDNTDSVPSVFGRAGAIIANNGDYTASQITNVPVGNISATTVQAAINELDTEKASTADSRFVTNGDSHDHVGGDGAAISLTSAVTGVLPIANGGTGSATQNFVDLTTDQTVGGYKSFTNTIATAGNLNFTGTGNRITGDFSNSTLANRVIFQNSVANGATNITAIPNGTSNQSAIILKNNVDPANCANAVLTITAAETILQSSVTGTGTLNPLSFRIATINQALLSTNGNFIIKTAAAQADDDNSAKLQTFGGVLERGGAGIGYGAGSGGQVTQLTSRTTGVTINKPSGAITLFSTAGSATWQSFIVTNSLVAVGDVVHVCQQAGTDKYMTFVTNISSGSFVITFATTGGTTTEQPVFNFSVIKGSYA